jgi:hypothetical protein
LILSLFFPLSFSSITRINPIKKIRMGKDKKIVLIFLIKQYSNFDCTLLL